MLSAENFRQLYVPPGFAHGFCVVSALVHVEYKCTAFYDPADEISIAWDDPEIGIEWPISEPMVSAKDKRAQRLKEMIDRLVSSRGVARSAATYERSPPVATATAVRGPLTPRTGVETAPQPCELQCQQVVTRGHA
jgi:hypothetical protein